MRPEQFAREARRWTAEHQADGGESEYRRLRARRCVRVWNDGDDGMVHLRGEFDPVTGKRIANRLREAARGLYDTDKQQSCRQRTAATRRSFDQCMADALDHLTSATNLGGGKSFADICVVAHVDDATGKLVAELPEGERLPARRCSNSSPATPSSPVSSMTAAANRSGAPTRAAPSPSPSGSCSSPNGEAASTAAPTPESAKDTTSNQPHEADPPNSTTSSRPAGAATTESTTTTGKSTRAPTAGTPSTHPTASTTDQRGLLRGHRQRSNQPAAVLAQPGGPHPKARRTAPRARDTNRCSSLASASAKCSTVDSGEGLDREWGAYARLRRCRASATSMASCSESWSIPSNLRSLLRKSTNSTRTSLP